MSNLINQKVEKLSSHEDKIDEEDLDDDYNVISINHPVSEAQPIKP